MNRKMELERTDYWEQYWEQYFEMELERTDYWEQYIAFWRHIHQLKEREAEGDDYKMGSDREAEGGLQESIFVWMNRRMESERDSYKERDRAYTKFVGLQATRGLDDPAYLCFFTPTATMVSFLQRIGTPEEIEHRIEAVLTLSNAYGSLDLDRGERKFLEIAEALEFILDRLCEADHAATLVTRHLRERGWEYDAATGKAKALQTPGVGNRPKALLAREIELCCEQQDVEGNTPEVREAIADTLATLFPAPLLDPGPRKPIWNAVNNWRATRGERPTKQRTT